MNPELACLHIIANCEKSSGILVASIVRLSRLPVLVVDRALADLRAAGHVSRAKVGYYTSPGYVVTESGRAAIGVQNDA